jgi:hypothetical protein
MKIAILKSPTLWLLVFAGLVTAGGFWGFSVSSYDKGGPFPLLLFLSVCLICVGGITTLISLVAVLGAILQRGISRDKHTTP